MIRLLATLALLGAALSSAAEEARIQPNVIYGHKDGMVLTYDVFHAAEPNGAAVLFMVSGGWFSVWMPPEQRLPWFQALLDRGFTVIAVHHGSAPRFKVPDAVSDVRAAVRHVKTNAADYGVEADRLGVYGGSAGGHLDPPILLVHGDADELVPISNSEILAEALDAAGVEHDFVTIEGAGHGFQGPDREQATSAMVSWFEQHLAAD